MLLGREEVWRKVLGFLSQGISSDERFPKPQLIAPTQASGLAPLSVPLAGALKGRAMLGREVPACYQVCLARLWRAWQSEGDRDAAVDVAM